MGIDSVSSKQVKVETAAPAQDQGAKKAEEVRVEAKKNDDAAIYKTQSREAPPIENPDEAQFVANRAAGNLRKVGLEKAVEVTQVRSGPEIAELLT